MFETNPWRVEKYIVVIFEASKYADYKIDVHLQIQHGEHKLL